LKGTSVGSGDNVLIVEDEDEWRKIYERAVSSQFPGQTVKVAKDLAGAERLIDSTKFAVAFVDVGLDISDDHNVDGLRVMEKIRATGDETSIVVVTGRSGQDVLPITRDAIKKYGAYDTVGKSTVGPSDIKRLLNGGLEAYRDATAPGRTDARDSIRGMAEANPWDSRATTAIGFTGGSIEFYNFLDRLFGRYLPLVAMPDRAEATIDVGKKFVYGKYWSRAIGEALLICFGAAGAFAEALETMPPDVSIHGGGSSGRPTRELVSHGVKGAVFILERSRRDEFCSI
jgi:ActR/RegA family two-component response regulator